MLVICFDEKRYLGGYGDRIVGLIAVYLMAKLLRRPFKILWTKEPMKTFLSYAPFDYEEVPPTPAAFTKIVNALDAQGRHKQYMMTAPHVFPNTGYPVTKIYGNQEIAQYLYKNPRFLGRADCVYLNDIYAAYKSLYKEILVPLPATIAKIDGVLAAKKPILIGIQVRAGDYYMDPTKTHRVLSEMAAGLPLLYLSIKMNADAAYGADAYSVFITSDYGGAAVIAETVWSSVLTVAEPPQHLDDPLTGDFSKVYVDNYILSQRTDRLYISPKSNYGRVAALSAVHDLCFDLKGEPIAKKTLLSKGEMLF
jgi:hypothetical protein